MKTNKTIRFDPEMASQLAALASERDMTVAAVVRTACEIYLMKQDLAGELNQVETRLAGALLRSQKETAKVGEDVQLLIALIDQLARFQFATTPDVIDKEAAAANANRRHDAFIQELHTAFSTRQKRSKLVQTLEGMGENP